MNEGIQRGVCKKLKGGKESSKGKKMSYAFTFSRILSLSLSLLLQKHSNSLCLSRSLAVILYFVVSKMYVRNESNIRSYVAISFLYTLSGADMIKAKSLPVLSTVALTP